MKTSFFGFSAFLFVIAVTSSAGAVVPDLIPVQGILEDNAGKLINGKTDIVFSLYDVKEGGTAFWTEEHDGDQSVSVENGFFSVYLGSITALQLAELITHDELWLGLRVVGDTEMERIQLMSVPFAVEAEYCQQIANDSIKSENILNGTITSDDIKDGQVAGSDIANSAITSAKIGDGQVKQVDLGLQVVEYSTATCKNLGSDYLFCALNRLLSVDGSNTSCSVKKASTDMPASGECPAISKEDWYIAEWSGSTNPLQICGAICLK